MKKRFFSLYRKAGDSLSRIGRVRGVRKTTVILLILNTALLFTGIGAAGLQILRETNSEPPAFQETVPSPTPDVLGANTVGVSANISQIETTQSTSFSLTNLQRTQNIIFNAQVPLNTSVQELNTTVLLAHDNFRLNIYSLGEPAEYNIESIDSYFNHSQFGDVYRIKISGGNQFYSNTVKLDGSCQSVSNPTSQPCGSPIIRLDDSTFFYATCDAEKNEEYLCSDIMKSLVVGVKRL